METISSLRFTLKTITTKHLAFIFEGLSDKIVTEHYGVHFNSLSETKEQINWYNNLLKDNTGKWWAIHAKDNTFYGAIGFNDLNKQEQQIEIGFWLLPKFWKQGVISECLPLVINYAFSNFNINSIIAYVESDNINSSTLLEKNNFIKSKKHIQETNKNGEMVNLNIFTYFKTK